MYEKKKNLILMTEHLKNTPFFIAFWDVEGRQQKEYIFPSLDIQFG